MKNKPTNSKTQGRINNNNNPSNIISMIATLIISTITTHWLSMLGFILGSLMIFTYVPDAGNYKEFSIMIWTSIYCVWVMIDNKNKIN